MGFKPLDRPLEANRQCRFAERTFIRMKQRVISALVGLVILGVVLAFIGTWLFNVVIAAISVIGLFEILRATGCLKNRALSVLSLIIAILVPFVREPWVLNFVPQIIFVFFVLFFVILIKNSATTRVEHTAMAFMFSIFIPLFFSCAVFMRDLYGNTAGAFYILLALGSAWLCDTGAYFVGRKFGKHKLAPIVSPKKTVEGAIGGLICGALFMLAIAFVYAAVLGASGVQVRVNYPALLLVTPICGILGMLGDLSASVIKRQFNVKDYGTIMPGHGGVMDRFDSVMFTLPSVFIISSYIQLIFVV